MTNTSSTNLFTLDVDDIIEEALEPLGGEYTSGLDAEKARRTLNLLLIDLQNKNIPMSKIDTVSLPIQPDVNTYTLDISISDILSMSLSQQTGIFIPLTRWGVKDFHDIPNKGTKERPNLYCTDRNKEQVELKIWPTPIELGTANLLVVRKIEDVTASYQSVDLPSRYLPLLVKWLSYELSLKRPGTNPELIALLKMRYEESLSDVFDEDRERVTFSIKPGGISGR